MTATYEITMDVLALRIAEAAYHYNIAASQYGADEHFEQGLDALRQAYDIAERLRCEAWTAELGVEHKPESLELSVERIAIMSVEANPNAPPVTPGQVALLSLGVR